MCLRHGLRAFWNRIRILHIAAEVEPRIHLTMGTNIGMMAGRRACQAANSSFSITGATKKTTSVVTSEIWRGIKTKCGVVVMVGREWHSQMLEEDTEGDVNTYFNANHFGESGVKHVHSTVSREHNNKHTQMII